MNFAIGIGILACVLAVSAAPLEVRQAGCDSACAQIAAAATACSSASNQVTCLCSTTGFVTAGTNCVACNGGSSLSAAGVQFLNQILQQCPSSGGSVSSSVIPTVPQSSSLVSTSVSTGTAVPIATGSAVRVSGTAPITVSAWAPNGFTPSTQGYLILATGGPNTTIEGYVTTTYTPTAAGAVPTVLTITKDFVLGKTAILEVDSTGDAIDYVYCQLLASSGTAQPAVCREILLQGSVTITTDLFTLTGSTKAWIASPVPVRSSGVASGTVTVGTIATATPVASITTSVSSVISVTPVVSTAASARLPGGFGFPTK